MTNRSTARSIDEYEAKFPPETRKVLQEMRALIRASAPGATEKISYAIPTFYLNGNLVHYAAFSRHVGFYPGAQGIATFKEELAEYESAKGSVQFPLGRSLPTALIRRMVEHRVAENARKAPTSRTPGAR